MMVGRPPGRDESSPPERCRREEKKLKNKSRRPFVCSSVYMAVRLSVRGSENP